MRLNTFQCLTDGSKKVQDIPGRRLHLESSSTTSTRPQNWKKKLIMGVEVSGRSYISLPIDSWEKEV
jgi:hypothetical protein